MGWQNRDMFMLAAQQLHNNDDVFNIFNFNFNFFKKKNVRFTTPTQEVHNNPSCEELLCTSCVGVVHE
jgi:hypothetical protein